MPRAADLPPGPPGSLWHDYFAKNRPPATAVQARVRSLNDEQEHEHVVALIKAALIHGQSQPWMYEVLTISMEITGASPEELERVVLSLADFGPASYDSMVQSAKYLLAFERREASVEHRQASLRLLKQAAELDADRKEAYLVAMPIIESTQSVEAAKWALPGAVRNLWGEGDEQARARALRIASRLARRVKTEATSQLLEDVNAAAIPDIRVTLTWDGAADLDLVVLEPNNTKCTHQSPITPTGGRLLEDGFGPVRPKEEYICPTGYTGDYLVSVVRAQGQPVANLARLEITVRNPDGTVKNTTQSIDISTKPAPIRLTLNAGRRTTPQQVRFERRRPPRAARPRIQIADADRDAADRRQGNDPVNRPVQAGAVGIAPQVQLINEGVQLQATPVVSPDRRYVRLGLQPWFQSITDVQTFTFSGPSQNSQQ